MTYGLAQRLRLIFGIVEPSEGSQDHCALIEISLTVKMQSVRTMCRYYMFLKNVIGVQKDDVVHMLTDGDHLDSVTSVVAVWAIGAIPAFGEATLTDDAIIDQVNFVLYH